MTRLLVRVVIGVSLAGLTHACGVLSTDPEPSSPAPDAATDAGLDDSSALDATQEGGPSGCWPYRPANYDPCVAGFDQDHPPSSPKTIDVNTTLETDSATDTLADGATTYALYRYASLTVAAAATLTVQGSRPALVVVDGDVDLEGPIVVAANGVTGPTECGARPDVGSPITNYTAGAGGAGYGTAGGDGGGGPMGGLANGNQRLAPLRFGCPGGTSGTPKPVSNGSQPAANAALGGAGGGALEISARGTLTVSNTSSVVANGTGGAGGDAHVAGNGPCQTADSKDCDSGGGGGGSGGSILLEGVTVNVMGSVCAVGGGGGAGGAQGGATGVSGATSTSCSVAPGGPTPVKGGSGGDTGAGAAGASGGGSYTSSGGGGGGAGRIRIRASGQLTVTGTVTPKAFTQ